MFKNEKMTSCFVISPKSDYYWYILVGNMSYLDNKLQIIERFKSFSPWRVHFVAKARTFTTGETTKYGMKLWTYF